MVYDSHFNPWPADMSVGIVHSIEDGIANAISSFN